MRYTFVPVAACEMCGSTRIHVLGMRLNRSQGRNPRKVSGIGVTLKKCVECELIFADPRPVPFDLSDHYGVPPEAYWRTQAKYEIPPDHFGREINDAKELLGFTPGMTALDIGAGIGRAMTAMSRAGFDVYGIEPSEPFRQRAVERTGIPADRLKLGSVEEVEYPEGSFDFITFGAVLEHLQEPAKALDRVLPWLKPRGVIQAEVPSSRHLIAKLVNGFFALNGVNYVTNLSPMHPPYHLYEFGLKSFEAHARRAGYEVARSYYSVCSIHHVPKVLHAPLRAYMDRTNTGMQLTVWLRKQ